MASTPSSSASRRNPPLSSRTPNTPNLRIHLHPHPSSSSSSRLTFRSDRKSVKKIVNLDKHIALACTGRKVDARVLKNKAGVECQSHRLTVEDPITVEYITRYIVGLQQRYTQSGGLRAYGLSTLIVSFDPYTGVSALYQTNPSGTFSAWKANTTGRNSNSMREILEKNYRDTFGNDTVKVAIRALLKGSVFVATSFREYFLRRGKVISILIEAIDIYLIGTVMLVLGMGLYELFICNLDPSKTQSERSNLFGLFTLKEKPRWLEIKSVNELKTKLRHVIVMILFVGFLEKSLNMALNSPQDILCFAASLLVSSCGLYLLSRLRN